MALSRLTEQQWVDFVVEPRFVDDARTENRSEERVVAVRKENIFCLSDIERWRGYLDPAPSWINVTLLRDDGETALFAVARSATSVNSSSCGRTAVNVGRLHDWGVVVE